MRHRETTPDTDNMRRVSMRQEQDTQSVESGPWQLQTREEQGEIGPDHHNSEVK